MVYDKKTITIGEKKNKYAVTKVMDSWLRSGYFVKEINAVTSTHTYETSGTPDTYTGHISDDGKTVTITKHPGSAGSIGSYTTVNYNVSLQRDYPNEQVRASVLSIEKNRGKNTEKDYFLIHKLLYGVLPCKEEELDSFSKVSTLSGKIIVIILCWFLCLAGLVGPTGFIWMLVTGGKPNGAYIFLGLVYSLIGLAMTVFFGMLAVKEMICRYYKRKPIYKFYLDHITPNYKDSMERCVSTIVTNGGTPKTTGGDLAKSIALAIVLLPIPIINIFYFINMILTIRDYHRWKKLFK